MMDAMHTLSNNHLLLVHHLQLPKCPPVNGRNNQKNPLFHLCPGSRLSQWFNLRRLILSPPLRPIQHRLYLYLKFKSPFVLLPFYTREHLWDTFPCHHRLLTHSIWAPPIPTRCQRPLYLLAMRYAAYEHHRDPRSGCLPRLCLMTMSYEVSGQERTARFPKLVCPHPLLTWRRFA